jgi:hypothetical protein
MPLQQLPVTGLDDQNHLRRHREITNKILTHQFDDSRVRTAAEISAGVTPVNYAWPVGYWDRYGTNTTPGTTDMSAAASAAFKVANLLGCAVRWGASAPYRLNSPVNCTQMRGVVAYDESAGKLSNSTPSIIVAHTGHGFDLTGSTEMVFHDMCAVNLSGTVPKTLFFMARISAPFPPGAGIHRFYNIRTDANAHFSHVMYNYGSEENIVSDCSFYQNEAGSIICTHTGTNTSGYTSTFATVATGSVSNVTHRYRGCTFFQLGNSGSANESCLQIESSGNFSFQDGSFYNPHGRAYVKWVGTSACSDMDFSNVRGEDDGVNTCLRGYSVETTTTTGAGAHTNWAFRNCRSVSSAHFLRFDDGAEIFNLDVGVCSASSGLLLDVYLMSYSRIFSATSVINGRAGGTVSNVLFIGNRVNVFLAGTASAISYADLALAQFGANGVRFPATQVASADANTLDDYAEGTWTPTITLGAGSVTYTTQRGTYTKVGRLVTIQCFIQVNTVSTPSGSLKISGLPFTSSSGLKGAASTYANSIGAVATPVFGIVDSAATTLSLFKLVGGTLANMGGDVGAGTQLAVTASYEV